MLHDRITRICDAVEGRLRADTLTRLDLAIALGNLRDVAADVSAWERTVVPPEARHLPGTVARGANVVDFRPAPRSAP